MTWKLKVLLKDGGHFDPVEVGFLKQALGVDLFASKKL